jgi:hypothetical protein
MATADQSRPKTSDLDQDNHLRTESRSVQRMSGTSNSLGLNLTDPGVTILGVEKGDQQRLEIFEDGIWIPKE